MKFLAMIKDRLKSISHTWIRFPFVFVLLCATAVFASINIETNTDKSPEILTLILGVFMSTAMTMAFEKRPRHVMWLFISQAVVLGLTAAYYFLVMADYDGSLADVLRIVILCFALIFISLWIPCLRWKTDFNDFFMTFFKAFFTTVFFIAIIWGGIALVLSAINLLLFRLPDNLTGHVAAWIWIFFAPMLFLSLIPVFGGTEEDLEKQEHLAKIPAFFRALLTYVLIPLTAIYTLVLLAYLGKTLVGGDEGDLLRPLILAYCIVVIFLYVLVSKIEHKIAVWFRLIAPKLMALIALYQVVNLILRITDEGIVYGRYFVILFGIFSVAAGVLISFLPLKKNVVLAIVLTGFALVSVTPPVDAFTISTGSQVRIVEQILMDNNMVKDGVIVPNKDLSENDKELITNAMQYLYDIKETDRISGIPDRFDMYADFQNVFGFSPFYPDNGYENPDYTSTFYSLDSSQAIEVGTYEYMVSVSANKGGSSDQKFTAATITDNATDYYAVISYPDDQLNLSLQDQNGKDLISASLKDMIDSLADKSTGEGKEMLPPDVMTFDVDGDGASVRIVFQYASVYEDGTNMTYDSNMYLFVNID